MGKEQIRQIRGLSVVGHSNRPFEIRVLPNGSVAGPGIESRRKKGPVKGVSNRRSNPNQGKK